MTETIALITQANTIQEPKYYSLETSAGSA